MVLAKADVVQADDLPRRSASRAILGMGGHRVQSGPHRKDHVRSILEKCGWNKFKAAKMMGISRSTLYSKMKKHGLTPPD